MEMEQWMYYDAVKIINSLYFSAELAISYEDAFAGYQYEWQELGIELAWEILKALLVLVALLLQLQMSSPQAQDKVFVYTDNLQLQ